MNFNRICRACLSQDENMTSLYNIYEHDLTLATILQTCIHSEKELTQNDGLPGQLCDNCVLILTQFYNFTIVYEDCEQQLKLALKKHCTLVEASVEAVEIHPKVEAFEPLIHEESLALTNLDVVKLNQQQIAINEESDEENFYGFQANNESDHGVQSTLVKLKTEDTDSYNMYVELDEHPVFLPEGTHQLELPPSDYQPDVAHQSSAEPELPPPKDSHNLQPKFEIIKKYDCNLCGEAHLFPVSFQHHMRFKHSLSSINCDEYATELKIEKKTEVDEQECELEANYTCKQCNKSFQQEGLLHHHLKTHDALKKFVCDVCGMRFIRRAYLNDHMEGHSNEKKHQCKFCGKAFRRRTVLRAHKRLHTHPNHYVCELCGRSFTNASTLKTHNLLIHLKERNFECLICNQMFPLKSTLTKHILRHRKRESGEKGFDCYLCDMEYKDKSSLKRHIDTRHLGKGEIVSCPDCSKMYASKANLMKHRRKNHPLNNSEIELSSG